MSNRTRALKPWPATRPVPRSAFKKGHKKLGGRKKGTPNAFTRDIKEALLEAFNDVGGKKWLKNLAMKDRRSFAVLIGKLLPTKVTGGDGESGVQVEVVNRIQANLSNLSDKELEAFMNVCKKLGITEIAG